MDKQELKSSRNLTKENESKSSEPVAKRSRSGLQRLNSRLVFTDPDKFFNSMYYDLLMEQTEQM